MSLEKDNPLVSIIMPAYNVEKYIEEAIQSILEQTYPYFELIIADDGSTDKTKEIIESFNDYRIIISHNLKNIGKIHTVNRLLKMTKGNYITIHDSDDISYPNRIEEQLNTFYMDTSLYMVGTWTENITHYGKLLRIHKRPLNYEDIKKKNLVENTFCGATMLIKREAYQSVGGYREYFHIGYEDYDLAYRISDKFKCINLAKPLYKYRQLPNSASRGIDNRRLVSDKLVQFLGKQRKDNNGIDCLMSNKSYILDEYLEKLLTPYKYDSSLMYRELASGAMYNNMYSRAIILSWKSIQENPNKMINWRTLFYCIRKTLRLP